MSSTLVDRLGLLEASIADLETEAQRIRNDLIVGGQHAYNGRLFRATV